MKKRKPKKGRGVYFLSCGRWLDKSAFIKYFEKKVRKTVRKYNLIKEKDKIAVAYSGGKDSITLIYLLNKIYSPRGQHVVGLAIDEGIPVYRDRILKSAEKFLKQEGIKVKVFSFKKEFGFNLKSNVGKIKKLGLTNCYICSILKRWLLNKKAKQLGFDVIATAHSLDDEAESILLNFFKGNPELLAKLGPSTGIARTKAFVQRVKPFYLCSTKEIVLYAKLKKIPIPNPTRSICPIRGETLRVEIRDWLSNFDKKHIEVNNAVVSSFLKIMPILKTKYKGLKFKTCKSCSFASSTDLCKACELLRELKIKPSLSSQGERKGDLP